jgi:hypothetical protein
MFTLRHLFTFITLSINLLLSAVVQATETTPSPANNFYAFVGNWKGQGTLSQAGQEPVNLELNLNCKKTSAGWGVLCEMIAKNKEMHISETDLFGVDPATNQHHWFSVTNMGETHDHLVEWMDATTMKGRYAWTQEGKNMEENISVSFSGKKAVEFRSIVSQEGQEVAAFAGTLKH